MNKLTSLPNIQSQSDFAAVKQDEQRVIAVCGAISAAHQIDAPVGPAFSKGSLIVRPLGEHLVLKLYSPLFPEDMPRERQILDHVHSRLSVPTPKVHHSGHFDGWPYLIMDRLEGRPMGDNRSDRSRKEELELCSQAGQLLRSLHLLPVEGLQNIQPDWSGFCRQQASKTISQQRQKGLPEPWCQAFSDFLPEIPWRQSSEWQPALLHTEMMTDHLLVASKPWRISGLIDFEPSTVGDPEYDFASVILFVTGADRHRQEAFLDGYGLLAKARNQTWKARVLGYMLLHKYSNLPWYFQFMPTPEKASISALIKYWFPFQG